MQGLVHSYCDDNADFFGMVQLGSTLEALTRLARQMWGSHAKVNDAMALILNKDLSTAGGIQVDGPADIIGTLDPAKLSR
mmetsp:Transcript_26978/g.47680  ORF Transcript_26978/g.47680 Transcript_26978/m.47680 type:complete len:80 (-) Transcript_26978:414-653(-)